MPEGDSVYRFAGRLRHVLEGREILRARAHGPGPVPRIDKVVGATCTGVDTHGKNLFIHFDNALVLRGHLRMYGSWHVYRPDEAWRLPERDARLVLEVDGATVVNFNAPVIELMEERALALHVPVRTLGPDLLAEEFDEEEVFRRFRAPERQEHFIGDVIMDQTIMAGVGNIWKHETLFRCAIYPWRLVRDIDDETLRALIVRARGLLLLSVGKGDDPRGGRRPSMFTYMRNGQPCRRCYARLLTATQGRDLRKTTWCPKCQPRRHGDPEPPYGESGRASWQRAEGRRM